MLKGAVSALVLMLAVPHMSAAHAADHKAYNISIALQPLRDAILDLSRQTDVTIFVDGTLVEGKTAPPVRARTTVEAALGELLAGSNLTFTRNDNGVYAIIEKSGYRAISLASESDYEQRLDDLVEEQEEETDDAAVMELQEIVVTGSHIRGAGPVGSQVFTYDRSEIDLQGFATLPDFMRSLPQNFNGGVAESTSQFGGDSPGARLNFNDGTGVNLRGLGNRSTLILLDGQRLSPSGSTGNFVDISMIPLSAIERVEVLTDGASATYGSDAVGGVVNYKVRKDYDGAETRLRYGFATQGGLEEILVGQTFGSAWDDGHALITGEYGTRDPLRAEDRSFSNNAPPFNDLLPEQERYSVFMTGGQKLSETVEVTSKAYFSRRDSARLVFQPNPLSTEEDPLDPSIPLTESTSANKQYGGTLGVNVNLDDSIGNDWRLDVVGGYNRNDSKNQNFEFAEQDVTGRTHRQSETLSVDAILDGTIFTLPGGDARLAIGGHYREEDFENPRTEEMFARNVKAVFGELYIPIVGEDNRMPGVEKLELSLAGRYEDYSDFGSSTDPKIGVRWSPVEGLNLRGSYSTSFRAPLLTELDDSGTVAFLTNSIPNLEGGTNLLVSIIGEGNPNLQPESATIWTGGFDLNPVAVPNLKINVTYFNIEYKDRIRLPVFGGFFTVLTDPNVAELVFFGAPDAEAQELIDNAQQINLTQIIPFLFGPEADFADADAVFLSLLSNLAKTKTTGLDFSASYALETEEAGTFNFSAGGSYIFDFEIQNTANAPSEEFVNIIQNPVNLRLNGGVSWSYEGFTAGVTVRHVGDYIDSKSDPDGVPVSSWTTTDLSLRYNTGDRFGGWLDNTTFVINARNLFDQNPPFVQSLRIGGEVNYDPNAADPMGRVLSFSIVKQW